MEPFIPEIPAIQRRAEAVWGWKEPAAIPAWLLCGAALGSGEYLVLQGTLLPSLPPLPTRATSEAARQTPDYLPSPGDRALEGGDYPAQESKHAHGST